MAAKATKRPILVRWHPLVGDSFAVQLDGKGQAVNRYAGKAELPHAPDGTYAHYPEGLFALFVVGSEIWVQWRGLSVMLLAADNVDWRRGIGGRTFKITRTGETALQFRYQGPGRYLLRPWLLVTDLFMPDDDWGLVADLPSFVHSHFRDRAKLADMIRAQVERAG